MSSIQFWRTPGSNRIYIHVPVQASVSEALRNRSHCRYGPWQAAGLVCALGMNCAAKPSHERRGVSFPRMSRAGRSKPARQARTRRSWRSTQQIRCSRWLAASVRRTSALGFLRNIAALRSRYQVHASPVIAALDAPNFFSMSRVRPATVPEQQTKPRNHAKKHQNANPNANVVGDTHDTASVVQLLKQAMTLYTSAASQPCRYATASWLCTSILIS